MKDKPIIFKLLPIFCIGISIGIPLQVMYLYQHNLFEWKMILNKITYLNWAVIFIFIANAIASYRVSDSLKYLLPLSAIIVAINNWGVGRLGFDYTLSETLAASLIYSSITLMLIFAKGIDILQKPQLHWWKIPKRFSLSFPIWIQINDRKSFLAKTFDVSETGAFISAIGEKDNARDFIPGDKLYVRIGIAHHFEFCTEAEVVRQTKETKGHYPEGLGIRFKKLNLWKRFTLNSALLSKQNTLTI